MTLVTGVAGVVLGALATSPLPAQTAGPRVEVREAAPVTLAGPAEERLRLGQLLGTDSISGFLLRSMSTMTPELVAPRPEGARGRMELLVLRPEARLVRNSALPTSGNDGALWAGRGTNALVRGGLALRGGPITLVLAPELSISQNTGFDVFPAENIPGRRLFSNPLFTGPYSADLPMRFGDQSLVTFGLGQSALFATTGPVSYGVSTENEWWGPGRHDALLLSSAAEGFPHAFVRTSRPIRTGIGDFEARWILGGLTESLYFDEDIDNDIRSLNGIAATWRPRIAPGLTLGVSRLVLAPVESRGEIASHAIDVLTKWANLGLGSELDTTRSHDQLLSLFGRWVLPRGGVEVYGEWARLEPPRNVKDLLLAPQNTQAWVVGLAKAFQLSRGDAIQAHVELTDLEQSIAFTDRPPPPDYYTGRAAPQGFTNRGQLLGATIGPGSSSQRLGVDYFARDWQAGVFLGRVRNQNDAMYRQFLPDPNRHDVSVLGGVRGGYRFPKLDLRAELAWSDRLNYLYQNASVSVQNKGTVDIHNLSLSIDLSPRGARSPRAPSRRSP